MLSRTHTDPALKQYLLDDQLAIIQLDELGMALLPPFPYTQQISPTFARIIFLQGPFAGLEYNPASADALIELD